MTLAAGGGGGSVTQEGFSNRPAGSGVSGVSGNGSTGAGGSPGQAGAANRGGGGGGGGVYSPPAPALAQRSLGGNGGSGRVVVRHASTLPQASSTTGNPTITTLGGFRIYIFNNSGTITW